MSSSSDSSSIAPVCSPSTSTRSPSSFPWSFFPCWLFQISTKNDGVLANSTVLSSRHPMNRGKRRLRPRECETFPRAATETGLCVMLHTSISATGGSQNVHKTYSAPRISQTSLGLKYTSGLKPVEYSLTFCFLSKVPNP